MTNILSHEEFESLVRSEHGDVLPAPMLIQSFDIEELLGEDWEEPKTAALRALTLNVGEPSMYTDRKGQVMVILPHGPLTYQVIESFFPVKKAWVYTLSDTVGTDLDEREYYFRYGRDEEDGNVRIPAYSPHDMTTH